MTDQALYVRAADYSRLPARLFQFLVAALLVLGPLLVTTYACLQSDDSAVRAHTILQGAEVIALTVIGALIAGAMHLTTGTQDSLRSFVRSLSDRQVAAA